MPHRHPRSSPPPAAAAASKAAHGGRDSGLCMAARLLKNSSTTAVTGSALQKQKARRHRCDPGSCALRGASLSDDTSTRINTTRIDLGRVPRIQWLPAVRHPREGRARTRLSKALK
jgi:hypothetical protein